MKNDVFFTRKTNAMRRKAYTTFTLFFAIIFLARAQQIQGTCQTVAIGAQKAIADRALTEVDSINALLAVWEKQCGVNEPIQRAKILVDIYRDWDIAGLYRIYARSYSDDYQERLRKTPGRLEEKFDYVAPGSEFDIWAKRWAAKLLPSVPEKSIEEQFCRFISGEVDTLEYIPEEPLDEADPLNPPRRANEEVLWSSIGAGAILPISSLRDYVRPSPAITISMGVDFSAQRSVALYLSVGLIINEQAVSIYALDSLWKTKNPYTLGVGLRFSKGKKLNKAFTANGIVGLGYRNFGTEVDKPLNDEGEENGRYAIGTFDASLGLGINWLTKNKRGLGFEAMAHFAPFNIDRKLKTNIGNQFVTLNVFYRFKSVY